jgi:uncharacterized protein YejL (UPF0352 family)
MIKSKDRAEQFTKELKELLDEYNAHIELENVSALSGYNAPPDLIMVVYGDYVMNEMKHECVAECFVLGLGKRFG